MRKVDHPRRTFETSRRPKQSRSGYEEPRETRVRSKSPPAKTRATQDLVHPEIYIPLRGATQPDFSSTILVLPSVSVGNVSQLCADVLLSTYDCEKIGYIHDRNVLPCVCNDALANYRQNSNGDLSLPIEVFYDSKRRICIVQQRSRIRRGGRHEFASRLVDWIRKSEFSTVIHLTTEYAYERNDEQISGPSFLFYTSQAGRELRPKAEGIGWNELVDRSEEKNADFEKESHGGSGITKKLFRLLDEHNVPVIVLMKYSHDGNNGAEAMHMSQKVENMLQLLYAGDASWPALEGFVAPDYWQYFFGVPSQHSFTG